MRGGHCLILQGRLHFQPFPFLLLFAASTGTTSVQRGAKLLPRRWQRTRPSQTSSAFIHPQALAVFESAIIVGMQGGHCLILQGRLHFHPFYFFFFFFQPLRKQPRSRGRQSACRGAGKEHDHHKHRVRSSLRKHLPSLKAQFSSLRCMRGIHSVQTANAPNDSQSPPRTPLPCYVAASDATTSTPTPKRL